MVAASRSFVPLVEMLVELTAEHGFTVAISVPNDAFDAVDNPYHRTIWGDAAFQELRAILPRDHVVAPQFTLNGSTVLAPGRAGEHMEASLNVSAGEVPSHHLAAFGPRVATLSSSVGVVQSDRTAERGWTRQREGNLAYYQRQYASTYDELRSRIQAMEDARAYIHDLEGRLGLPLSGTHEDDSSRDPAP